MADQDINVTEGSTNIEVTIEDDQVINITFPGASSGQVLLTDLIEGVSPVETPNGSLKVFTLPNGDSYVPGRLKIHRSREKLIPIVDFTETSPTTFTLAAAQDAPDADEPITLDYIKQ